MTSHRSRDRRRWTRDLWLPFNDGMLIVSMTAAYAAEITTWCYPPPYDCYDMTSADPAFLASPGSGFFALIDETGLIGFRSFGPDGQVPGGAYDDSALDTGGGLRPDLTGKGKGRQAIQTGLDFGQQQFAPQAFRVTIATFNIRAQRVVTALGFRNIGRFCASADGRRYEMLIRPEPGGPYELRRIGDLNPGGASAPTALAARGVSVRIGSSSTGFPGRSVLDAFARC